MANDENLPVPIEIPWQLISSTQALKAGGPDDATVSLFMYEPEIEEPDPEDPDAVPSGDQLVYFKFTVSISPIPIADVTSVDIVRNHFDDTTPIYAVLLDLKLRPQPAELGGIKPYFHSAAPLHRRVIETGVVGDDLFEGEVDAQHIGRSGSQLHESTATLTNTTSGSAGLKIGPFGASVRSTTTGVDSSRSVDQVVDTTTRDASQERRELISHMTKVENVLTLLSAKHLGSPYLRFSLYPRPLRPLSVDPADPNLWFSQLLARRSSGIEGIQEFSTVAVVPRGQEFCVEARLRRVSVLDDPPGPPDFDERFVPDFFQLLRTLDYLYRQFPIGTPLEELDVDLTGKLTPGTEFPRPAIRLWTARLDRLVTEAQVVSPGSAAGTVSAASVNYKHLLELWLETLRSEHAAELTRSPLERGVVLAQTVALTTCLGPSERGLAVTSSTTFAGRVTPLPFDPGLPEAPPASDIGRSARSESIRTVTNWNALERRLTQFLSNRIEFPDPGVSLDDPRVVELVTDRWARLTSSSPNNLELDEVASRLRLSAEHLRALDEAGASDLRGLGQALRAATSVERQNTEIERFATTGGPSYAEDRPADDAAPELQIPQPIEFPVSASMAADIRRAIGEALQAQQNSDGS
jgi:hypothetical protein